VQTLRYNRASAADPAHVPPISTLDQPPTFFWLGFMITVEAIVLSIFVLNAQRRQASRDAIKADMDYQVNRKAHLEIMQLHEKLDRLEKVVVSERNSD
jgi:CRP/FNR family transcriptional regulator, cyclic AMP receptor protein